MRLDSRLQECQDAHWKQSFPDLDYAFFGYDILKGYPLASGHDPGFTHPIFLSDYESGKQTSDCRYSVPKGLVVVPDVSCVSSFSSKVITKQTGKVYVPPGSSERWRWVSNLYSYNVLYYNYDNSNNENPRHGEQEVVFEKAVSIPILGEPQLMTLRW